MHPIINNVISSLRNNNLQPAYENKKILNDIALSLYNKQILTSDNIEELKNLLIICNITYNDTDKDLLPIEDGIYDLLLEKYKTYDPNFQVGAEVISFKSSSSSQSTTQISKSLKEGLIFVQKPSVSDTPFMNQIVVDSTKYIDHRDFEISTSPVDISSISKRYHNTMHEHPELVGTLDKCKFVLDRDASERGVLNDSNVKTLERDFFQNHIAKGIISTTEVFDMILELKYDGVSVEADCTDEIVSARSRGDTGVGKAADLTPLLKGYKFPHRPKGSPMIGVKFEAIMTQLDLQKFNSVKGYEYKNCRTAIVGLMSSSDAWKYREFITLVPLAVEEKVYTTTCHSDRLEEINFLNSNFISHGCPLRYTVVNGTYIENLAWINIFTQNAESLRYLVPFMYDGIIVSYRDERIRKQLGRENFINKFSIAVKFNPLRKETIFRGYSYTVGQDGSITPMIHYDPVEFYGTIHTKSSGHSFARFQELALHQGDIISVEYVNDVMPYVSKVINDYNLDNEKIVPLEIFPTNCPICNSTLDISLSKKSAKCINPFCGGRQLARMVNMCQKLEMDGFGESTISKLDVSTFEDLATVVRTPVLMRAKFGEVETENMKAQITRLLTCPLDEAKLLGAIGFTGISTKTWELILSKIPYYQIRDMLVKGEYSQDAKKIITEQLVSIKGIGPATADTIVREFATFQDDLDWFYANANIQPYVAKSGKKIRFSGFRSEEFAKTLEEHGFIVDMNAGVTKDTFALLVPYVGYSSSKTKRAESLGVMIVPVADFVQNFESYL